MRNKIKELYGLEKAVGVEPGILDNIAAYIFDPKRSRHQFVHSINPPTSRYGIDVPDDYLSFNDNIKNFDKLGPNEKFLINKMLDSPCYLLYIVGGIGVGKSTFLKYYIENILPTFEYDKDNDQRESCVIFFDFLDEISGKCDNCTSESRYINLSTSICDRIQAEFIAKNFFSLEEEVTIVWDALISQSLPKYRKNNIISKLITELQRNDADNEQLGCDTENVMNIRKGIREEILNDYNNRILYLAIICRYIKEKYYSSNPNLFLMIIDNIDRETLTTQQMVKLILKPFVNLSEMRVIVTMRQTTYYQQLEDGDSEHTDKVPYCGVGQMEVIKSRLEYFHLHYNEFTKFIPLDAVESLLKTTRFLVDKFLNHPLLTAQYTRLCGHSIRKSLILSQNLIDNYVYNPIKLGLLGNDIDKNLYITNILRALYVGNSSSYTYNVKHIIENIYQVQGSHNSSYFIKLRILSIILASNGDGVKINKILGILGYYDYSLPLICNAINELKIDRKKLIWSDCLQGIFQDEDEMLDHGNSRLFLSSRGEAYIEDLFSDLNYIQEVMMDTFVDSRDFVYKIYSDKIVSRCNLVINFVSYLLDEEVKENGVFFSKINVNHNIDPLIHIGFYTCEIFKKLKESIKILLDAHKDNISHNHLSDYTISISDTYDFIEERINYSSSKESEFFNN